MRQSLLAAALLVCFLGTVGLAQAPAFGQAGTPGPERSPAASPVASPAACAGDAISGRLVAVPNKVTIELTDEGFEPGTIQTTNNADLAVTLINTGSRPHAFVLDDFDLRVELAPGEREELSLTPIDFGDAVTHYFHSDLPGDECMRGKLIFYISQQAPSRLRYPRRLPAVTPDQCCPPPRPQAVQCCLRSILRRLVGGDSTKVDGNFGD